MRNQVGQDKIEITADTLKELLDYSSDEIFIFNQERQVIYANKVCERNYGLSRNELIGKYSHDLFEKNYWTPSIYPEIYKSKKPVSLIQTTITGAELLTSAIPVLNDNDEVELLITTARDLKNHKLVTFNHTVETKALADHGIVTHSEKMKRLIHFSKKVATTNSTIFIKGETGTGKGVLANYIHQISERKNKPFLTINCANIPEKLLESELFGYKKGAFTGSNPGGKTGLMELADKGTVFLDEIGDISFQLQAKLLQVIQDKEFIPVGGHKKKKVDIRFIAATNRNLEKMMAEGKFREDLYYRLNVIDITLPPLRKRKEDIIPLVYYFLNKFNEEYETNKLISQKCLDQLDEYSWPGNIRQLENLIEKLVIISDNVIDLYDLPETFLNKDKVKLMFNKPTSLPEAIEQTRKQMIRSSFKKHKSSRRVAKDLDISQTTATRLIKEYCSDLRDEN